VGSDSGGCSLDFVAASPDENFDFVIEQEFHSRINVAESTTREKAAGRFFVSLKKVTGVEEEEKGDEDKNKHKNNDEEKEKNGEDEDDDFDEDEQGYISKSTAFRWKSIFKNKYKGSAILWYDMQKQFYLEEHDKEFNVLLGDDDETEELRELFEEFEAEVNRGKEEGTIAKKQLREEEAGGEDEKEVGGEGRGEGGGERRGRTRGNERERVLRCRKKLDELMTELLLTPHYPIFYYHDGSLGGFTLLSPSVSVTVKSFVSSISNISSVGFSVMTTPSSLFIASVSLIQSEPFTPVTFSSTRPSVWIVNSILSIARRWKGVTL